MDNLSNVSISSIRSAAVRLVVVVAFGLKSSIDMVLPVSAAFSLGFSQLHRSREGVGSEGTIALEYWAQCTSSSNITDLQKLPIALWYET